MVAETCVCDALLLECEQFGLLSARLLGQKLIRRSSGNRIGISLGLESLCTFTIINGEPLVCTVGCLPLRMCERFAVFSLSQQKTFDCWAVSELLTRCLSPFSSKLVLCFFCSLNKWHLQNVLPLIIKAIWLKQVTLFLKLESFINFLKSESVRFPWKADQCQIKIDQRNLLGDRGPNTVN